MKFHRMLLMNADTGEDFYEPIFIYRVGTPFEHDENLPANQFVVESIELLDNGWVYLRSHDDMPDEAVPPWRVIVLEDSVG